MHVSAILRDRPAPESPQSILEPVGIRQRADDPPAWTQDARDLAHETVGSAEVLEQFGGDDDVERGIVEWKRSFRVCPDRLDAERGRLLERLAVDVDADDLVAGRVRARQRPGPATEVQNALARTADDLPKRLAAFSASPDEAGVPAAASMVGVERV
jgi:hypothetical protein